MSSTPTHRSLWMEVLLPEFPALQRDIEVDVLVVGAGLTGITAAYLLGQEGVRVALIDRKNCQCGLGSHDGASDLRY